MLNIHMTDKFDWLGTVDKSKLPVEMHVDYFRIYEKSSTTPILSESQKSAMESNRRSGLRLNVSDILGRLQEAADPRPLPGILLPAK